ncbi:ABC transporter ATP-binding protein [Thauera sp. Sel9]|uniref:ABC transporter ATP-binding protein n=1 Tax=Thauera sp. Sel9 TaxID=2974299 RepID=UPI0021E16CCB|nr:ABC transporter ATP-binding protein [Thauera sp. Sel9]MCV2218506.1 ABC transporter ATP-binding protein [Thauera sp. Sel9]
MAFLDIEKVVFTYPGRAPVVDGVDWRMQAGEFHCLLGRSGCGKTTLLKLAAGLLRPQAGRIVLRGGELAAPGPQVGFMFQAPTLLDWLSVLDNVLLPVSLQRRPTPQDQQRALQLLDQLGLASHAPHHPRQLSGGQQSRVALARALVLEPPLLLLDEPFAALDAITRAELQDDLLRTCRERGTTVLFVTHDINEAVYLGDRIALMHGGRIVENWTITLPLPRTQAMRHGPAFNDYCARVRAAMDGAGT